MSDAIGRQHIGADQVGAGVVGQRDAIGRGGAVIVIEPPANAEQPAVRGERGLRPPTPGCAQRRWRRSSRRGPRSISPAAPAASPPPAPPAPRDGTPPWDRIRRRHRGRSRAPDARQGPAPATSTALARCGIWVPSHTVSDCSAASKRASTPRGSIEWPPPLWRWKRSEIRWAAPAKAPSMSPYLIAVRATRLSGQSSRARGAPGCDRREGIDHRRQRLARRSRPGGRRPRRRGGSPPPPSRRVRRHGRPHARRARRDRHRSGSPPTAAPAECGRRSSAAAGPRR